MSTPPPPKDILGLAPYGEALKILTQGVVDGAAAFFGRLVLPAAEEIGLAFRDRVSGWRAVNLLRVAAKVEERLKLEGRHEGQVFLDREFAYRSFDWASWCEQSDIQNMWAGLIAANCSSRGTTDGILCATLLSRLTPRQALILEWSAKQVALERDESGAITTRCVSGRGSEIMGLFGSATEAEIGAELHHMKTTGLLHSAALSHSTSVQACVALSLLGAMLFVRTQGSSADVAEVFPLGEAPRPS
jgi:hypothetical protein